MTTTIPVLAEDLTRDTGGITGRQGFELAIAPVPALDEDEAHTFRVDVMDVGDPDVEDLWFRWDFGDQWADAEDEMDEGVGLLSTTHAYTKAGDYTVELLVEDTEGQEHRTRADVQVRNVVPVPKVTLIRQSTFEDEVVTFSPLDSWDTASDLPSLTYSWTLAGEEPTPFSDGPMPERTYTTSGTYSVTLRAKDDDGAIGTIVQTFRVDNQPPFAIAGADDVEVSEDDIIMFSGLRSLDTRSDVEGLTYEWDFGDGHLAEGPVVEHSYGTSGEHVAILKVRDGDGAVNMDHVVIKVSNEPPDAIAQAHNGVGGSLVVLDASMTTDSSSDMPMLVYCWVFEDGSETTGKVITHRFKTVGTHSVTLQVTDPEGDMDTDTIVVTITNLAPVIRMDARTTLFEDEETFFDGGKSYDVDGSIVKTVWDLGDGTTLEGTGVHHSYKENGVYRARLTLTDDMGTEAWEVMEVTVLNMAPEARVRGDMVGAVGKEMLFDGSMSADTVSDQDLLTYGWDFGDGHAGHGKVVTHAYAKAGEYEVVLTVTDDDGSIGEAKARVMVLAEDLLQLVGDSVLRIDLTIWDQVDGEEGIAPGERIRVDGRVSLVTEIEAVEGLDIIDLERIEVMVLLMETGARHYLNPAKDGSFSVGMDAPGKDGRFTVLTVATLRPLKAEATVIGIVRGTEEPVSTMVDPMVAGVATATISIMAIGAVGGTDIGRYKFFTLMIPLFTRLKRPKVLDHFERGRIYEHVRKNPGDSYSSMKRTLGMKNGALAHHLRVLEAHEYIVSRRDGMYKRFYPKGMKIPEGAHKSIQQNILEMIMSNPKISQKDIAGRLGVDRSTVNYHVKILLAMGVIRSEKEGRTKYYYFVGVKEPLPYGGSI